MELDNFIKNLEKKNAKNKNMVWYNSDCISSQQLNESLLELAKAIKNNIEKPIQISIPSNNKQLHDYKKDLDVLFEDQKHIQYPIIYKRTYGIEVQLTGISISLTKDGTYFINDTTD